MQLTQLHNFGISHPYRHSLSRYQGKFNTMDKFQPDASDRSNNDGPANNRFTSQAATAEDLLKSQTVGLVNLNDYRKRRAEALDLKERGITSNTDSGASTPVEEYESLPYNWGMRTNLQSTEHPHPSLCSRRSAR
jgi:hypothetical protein